MALKEYSNDTLTQYLKSAVACLSNATGITGFVLNHNYTAIFEKVKPYLNVRNEIIEKYGEEADDGSFIIVDDEKLEQANKELQDYANLKISVDIVKIPEEKTLESGLTSAQLMSLSWMIKSNSSDDLRTLLCIPDYDAEEEETADSYDPKEPVTDERFV